MVKYSCKAEVILKTRPKNEHKCENNEKDLDQMLDLVVPVNNIGIRIIYRENGKI